MKRPHFLYHAEFDVKHPQADRGFNWGLVGALAAAGAVWFGVFYLAYHAFGVSQ